MPSKIGRYAMALARLWRRMCPPPSDIVPPRFIPPLSTGIVRKVIDGDTAEVWGRLDLLFAPYTRFTIRLKGIDTPERSSSNAAEKQKAEEARQQLASFVLGRRVRTEGVKPDKYGSRLVADLIVASTGMSCSQHMLETGHARKYDGGKKLVWTFSASTPCEVGRNNVQLHC